MAQAVSRSVQSVGITATAALALALAMTHGSQAPRFVPSEHPAAVLAWAQLRCNPELSLKLDAPRAHAEDVLEVSAAYDQALRYRPAAAVCADALRAAGDALAPMPAAITAAGRRNEMLAAR